MLRVYQSAKNGIQVEHAVGADRLDSTLVASVLESTLKEQAKKLATKEELRQRRDEQRPVPPYNVDAVTPAEVYPLRESTSARYGCSALR